MLMTITRMIAETVHGDDQPAINNDSRSSDSFDRSLRRELLVWNSLWPVEKHHVEL